MQNQIQTSEWSATNRPKQLRSACDSCHQQKIKCSGRGSVCERCQKHNLLCHYSEIGRLGKPKGAKNKKTIERERQNANFGHADPPVSQRSQSHLAPIPQAEELERLTVDEDAGTDAFLRSLSAIASPSFPPYTVDNMFNVHAFDTIDSGPVETRFDLDFDSVMIATDNQQFQSPGETPPSRLEAYHDASRLTFPPPMQEDGFYDGIIHGNSYESGYTKTDIIQTPGFHGLSSPTSFHGRVPNHTNRLLISPDNTPTTFELKRPRENPPHCDCLQVHANVLCGLNATDQSERVDALLRSSGSTFPSLERSLQCTHCLNDSQVLQMCSMILKNLLRWINATCSSDERVDVRVGDYRPNKEELVCIHSALFLRLLSKYKSLLVLYKRRLDRSKVSGGYEGDDAEYLNHTLGSLSRSVDSLIEDLRPSLE
ncbi:hypothetical protein BCR34DRAFT_662934 [Clohesyomyces aquaticus]|uniref:Zn(2)-C6 fungal-type domain-containing protein n=1 Tax=Clohesyomyces aquaticus TaxID=1231657 RepID=A0A1Y1ZUH1_9PLEO|nr:hypothetical protein BCR34DRAFT_662934 [Clohesyomyces aquaticus]